MDILVLNLILYFAKFDVTTVHFCFLRVFRKNPISQVIYFKLISILLFFFFKFKIAFVFATEKLDWSLLRE